LYVILEVYTNIIIFVIRPVKFAEDWKMREHHVFFLYFLHDVWEPFVAKMDFGKELLEAIKHLQLAIHLVKGDEAEVDACFITFLN
jgi:hypothetical protein